MTEHLLHEEGVPLGLLVDELDQLGRGLAPGAPLEKRRDALLGHAAEHDLLGPSLAQEVREDARQRPRLELRVSVRADGEDRDLSLDPRGRVIWQERAVARVMAGDDPLAPKVELLPNELLAEAAAARLARHVGGWIVRRVHRLLGFLLRLRGAELSGAVRGLAYQLCEGFSAASRAEVEEQV